MVFRNFLLIFFAVFINHGNSFSFNIFTEFSKLIGVQESCYYSKWIPVNIEGLESDLSHQVFGQPFISAALIPLLKYHYSTKKQHNKALAFSFHGSPGTGKNFVTELIANNLFAKGYGSQFVHFFSGQSDFTMNADIEHYKAFLRDFVESKITLCEWSMFVFDETDKIPEGVLDVLKTFLEVGKRKNGIDFRRALFIFLSNIGESHLIDKTLALWKDHIPRNQFKLKEFQDILIAAAYNEKGGLKLNPAVRSALIDVYLPFLPLERRHIVNCVIAESKRQNYTVDDNFVKNVIAELDFGPSPENVFASHGCKQIESKVVLLGAAQNDGYDRRFVDEL